MSSRILLADDERLILATLGEGLRSAGYTVCEANSGEEALDVVRREPLDLAILDVRMERTSGLDVAAWLRKHTNIPFIFLSAYGDSTVVRQGVSEGALSYLVKPLDTSQLIPAIEAALSRADEIRQLRETKVQLTTALEGSRKTSIALGLLMERHHLSEEEAFNRLRMHARSQRRKVNEVAVEIVTAEQLLNLAEAPSATDRAVEKQ